VIRRLRLAALVLLIVIGAGACRVDTQIGITVNENGSGTVTVRVGLDDDALRRVPTLVQDLKTDDLKSAGWTVQGPAKASDDLTYISASKNFANPEEASKVLAEISGPNGPFRDFAITRTRSFAKTMFTFEGTVDFTGGLESFSDSELAAQLDGKPLGDDLKAIEDRVGEPLDTAFQFHVVVRLPGKVKSNAPIRAGNGSVWQPKLSDTEPLKLTASSTDTRWLTLIASGIAIAAGVAVLVLVVLRLLSARRRGRHARHARHAAT
jgi:hypothetical protein